MHQATSPVIRPHYALALLALHLACFTYITPTAIEAQEEAAARPGRPAVQASRLDTPPTLDGEVARDPAWSQTIPASGFSQTTPDEGQPASQRTEVFIGFTDETFYIGVICHDDQPEEIIVSDSRRDASLNETDSFQVILDTFRDRQSGFVFGTNPAGIEYDGQVTKEGSGSFGSGGGGFNLNWDASWEVKAQITDIGWSAEMAIPFRTLRFGAADVQSWGVNFQRNIRRRNERSFWAPLPRQFNLFRLSLAGAIEQIEPPAQRNLKLIPYVLAQGRRGGVDDVDESDEDFGLDVKYSITPSLTLDATYNTDFAQVEADEQQINLDRFSLFFPEKRPFFLENAGQFAVGAPEEIELFFSRRIGIGVGGGAVPIELGARLTGKVGGFNVGLIGMRAEAVNDVAPRNDFTVARLSRELPNRSSLGVMYVGRDGDGSLDGGLASDDNNRTYSLDGRWGIGKGGQIRGFLARTQTPGIDGDDHAFRIGGGHDSENWSTSVNLTEVGAGFNPEVGFLARSDYRKADGFALRRIRPKNLWGLHELRPHVSYRGFWGSDDFQETGFLHVDNHFEWPSGFELHTGVNFTREGLRERFEIAEGVFVNSGTYDHEEAQIVLITNEAAPLSFNLRLIAGGFFGGDRLAVTPTVRFRIGETFTTELRWSHNDISIPTTDAAFPGGDFKTNLARLRLSYSFTPKIFLQALVQYNDRSDVISANLRFGWLQEAGTGLFLVYNELDGFGMDNQFGSPDRALIIKYSRIFDLLR